MRAKGFRLHRSVYIRLLVLTVLATLVFYAMGVFLNHMGIKNAEQSLKQMAGARVQYLASELERSLNNLQVHIREIAGDEQLERLASEADADGETRTGLAKDLAKELSRVKRMSTLVDSASILLPERDEVITADHALRGGIPSQEAARLERAADMGETTCLREPDGLALLYRVRFEGGDAVLCVRVPYAALMEKMRDMSTPEDAAIALLGPEGEALASEGAEVAPPMGVSLPVIEDVTGTDYVFAEASLSLEGLQVRYCRQVDSALNRFMRHGGLLWVLSLMTMGLLIAYITYFRKAIYHPLNTIYKAMEQAEKPGEFEIREHSNEFDDIYTQFRHMVNRLERLASEVYEERYRATQAELAQLQTQINPHFFYNTLFLIYRMARDEGCDDIAELAGHLSRFYRYITKFSGQTVALRDEIEHIRNYLEIQRMRFEPRVKVEIQPLPEAIAGERIPSLVIQPLVENAFVHGVKDAAEGAKVAISYEYGPDWFKVIVADSGGGMTEARVEALRRALDADEMPEGSALSNLKRRMEMRYGAGYTLGLACVDGGLTASVTFPRGEEGPGHDVAADR